MKKRPLLLTLALLCLLTLGFSTGTLSRYVAKLQGETLTVSIDGRTYEGKAITEGDTQAYSISEDGALTIRQYFFVPEKEGSDKGKWYVTTGLGDHAFHENTQIKTVHLPDYIATMGEYALSCPNLETITVDENGNFKVDENGDLYSKDGTLYRHFYRGGTWFHAGALSIKPGALSYSGYCAILSDHYDGKAWGAGSAIIVNTQQLSGAAVTNITASGTDYTVTLSAAPLLGRVIYHQDTDPEHSDHTMTNEQLAISEDNTVSFAVSGISCSHGRHTQVWLSSYERYAYGYIHNGILEIHNCYIVQTDDGVVHQWANGVHNDILQEDVVNNFYSLPLDAAVDNSYPWNDISWGTAVGGITGVKVVDHMAPSGTTEWFDNMGNAVWMDLENLQAEIALGAFAEAAALKVIFYQAERISGAPWGVTNALVVNNKESLDLAYVSETNGSYTLSVEEDIPAVLVSKAVTVEGEAANDYRLLEVKEKKFTIPKEFATYGDVVTVTTEGIQQYTYAVLGENKALSVRSRLAVTVEEDSQLVDKEDTYPLGAEGTVYALPYGLMPSSDSALSDVRVAAGDVPANAIETGWTTVHNQVKDLENIAISVTFADRVYLQGNLRQLFQHWPVLTSIDLTNADFSAVTNTIKLFDYCPMLETITFSLGIDTSNVTTMQYMFYGLSSLTGIDLSGIDTDKVTSMASMFEKCSALTGITFGDMEAPELTTVASMFSGCTNLATVTFSNITAPKLTTMSSMFYGLANLTSVTFGDSVDTPGLTDMNSMFGQCKKLVTVDFGKNFNTSNVTNMGRLFWDCNALKNLNISSFNTSKVKSMGQMFSYCSALTELDLTHFDTSSVESMNNMFSVSQALTTIKWDPDKFITSNVTNMGEMFSSCRQLKDLDVSHFDTSKVTTMASMFNTCHNLKNLDLSSFDTSKVENMDTMFKDYKDSTILVSELFVTDSLKSSTNMFQWCNALAGGNGTTLKQIETADPENYVNAKYAHIDGGTSNPGYFTKDFRLRCDIANVSIYSREENPEGTYTATLTTGEGVTLPEEVTLTKNDGTATVEVEGGVYDQAAGTVTFTISGEIIPGTVVTIGEEETKETEPAAEEPVYLEQPTTVYTAPAVPPSCGCETRCSETVRNDLCPVCAKDYLSCTGSGNKVTSTCSCAFYCGGVNQQPCDVCLTDPGSCQGEDWFP